MLSLNEEQLQKQNKFLTNWTIILGIFNLDNQDVEGNILFLDELTRINFKSVHEIELSNMQTIWLGGIGLLLFGSMISLGLIIAKKNQIATIISKKQQEKLEKLSEQVIDKYLIKYTFKHILKAVQKKKREICTQLKNSATQESIILNKLKGRCDSILQSEECGICMCSFENDELCRLIMCDHVFHAKCIDEWAIRNQNCPFCRTELSEQAMAIWKESQKGYPYPLDQSLHSSQFETDQSFKQKNESEQKQQEVSIRIGQRKYIDKDFILNNKKNDKDDDCYNLYNIDPQNEQAKNNISTFENKEPISPFKVFDTQRILPDQEDMQSIKTIKTQVIIEDKAEGSIQNILDLNTQSNSKKEHLQKVNGKSELRLKNNIFSKRPSKSQLISSTLTYCLPNSQSQTHRNSIQKLLSNAKADQQEQQE